MSPFCTEACMHLAAGLSQNPWAPYKTPSNEEGRVNAEEPNSPEPRLCLLPKGAFFPPSLPLTAAEKRKLNILVMLIFSAPHAHFLGNEDLPTFTNSNSFLPLPLGAVKVQHGSVLLSKKVWKQHLSFKVTPTKCLKFSFLGSYKQNLAESPLLWSSFSTDKQIFKLKVAPVSHK